MRVLEHLRRLLGRDISVEDNASGEMSGFVLAEAVVAITIAAIGVGGALLALRQAKALQAETLNRIHALVICEEKLREAMANSGGSFQARTENLNGGFEVKTTYTRLAHSLTLDGKPYSGRSATIERPEAQVFRQITTQVSWQSGRRQRQVALEALIPESTEIIQ